MTDLERFGRDFPGAAQQAAEERRAFGALVSLVFAGVLAVFALGFFFGVKTEEGLGAMSSEARAEQSALRSEALLKRNAEEIEALKKVAAKQQAVIDALRSTLEPATQEGATP